MDYFALSWVYFDCGHFGDIALKSNFHWRTTDIELGEYQHYHYLPFAIYSWNFFSRTHFWFNYGDKKVPATSPFRIRKGSTVHFQDIRFDYNHY
jgi:hypothetical protein